MILQKGDIGGNKETQKKIFKKNHEVTHHVIREGQGRESQGILKNKLRWRAEQGQVPVYREQLNSHSK